MFEASSSENNSSMNLALLLGGICVLMLIICLAYFYKRSSSTTTIDVDVEDFVRNSYIQAMEWHQVGSTTKNPTEKAVAYTRALAFLNSVRISVKDEKIEELVKDDVVLFAKTLEENQISSIKAIDEAADSFASTFVIR